MRSRRPAVVSSSSLTAIRAGDDGSAIPLDVPGMGTSFDYFVDTTVEGGKFVPWRNIVPSFKYEKDRAYTAPTRREK